MQLKAVDDLLSKLLFGCLKVSQYRSIAVLEYWS